MKVYMEKKDIPDHCTSCPFTNRDDECILQDEDANYNAGSSWDALKAGCPIKELPEQKEGERVGRLIEKDEAIKIVQTTRCKSYETFEDYVEKVVKAIEDAPAVDAEPVRHGRWVLAEDGFIRCSECKRRAAYVPQSHDRPMETKTDYCPVCGADMREGDNSTTLTVELAGLHLHLPIKIGDDVYIIPSEVNQRLNKLHRREDLNRVHHQRIERITITHNGWFCETDIDREWGVRRCYVDVSFGETWFLTREEAEQALRKGAENDGR